MSDKDTPEAPKPLFRNLNADDSDPEATEIESLCLNCEENVSMQSYLCSFKYRSSCYSSI